MKVLDYDGTYHLIDKIYDALNSGGSADYIVEEGTSGIWTYRKWASGVAECWGFQQYSNLSVTRQYGSVYLTANNSPQAGPDFPFTISNPVVQRTVQGGNQWILSGGDPTTTNSGEFWICRPASATGVNVKVGIYVKGLWKDFTPSVSVGHIDLVGYDVVTGTNPITIPPTNEWRFAIISAYVNTGNYVATYQTMISNNQTFSTAVLLLGGYYYASGDTGLCNVNIDMNANGGTMTLRNFYYAGRDFKSGANLGIRYYGTK